MVGRQVVLPELDDRPRALAGPRVQQSHGLHRSEPQGVVSPPSHLFDRKAAFEERRAIERVKGGLLRREQGRLTVELTTAYELDDAEIAAIVRQIEQASGQSVEATRSVDPDLIGGLRVRVGSDVWDGSIREKLARLSSQL